MATGGLAEFKQVLAEFRQVASLALKGVVAAPLTDIWLKLGPPPAKAIGALTVLFEFLVVVWVFQFWFNTQERVLHARMKVALGLFVVGVLSSVLLLHMFSYSPGPDQERVIAGYSLRADVKPVITGSFTAKKALQGSEFDADQVWTRESIAVLRTLITAVWLATFASFAAYLTVFIILQRRGRAVQPAAPPH